MSKKISENFKKVKSFYIAELWPLNWVVKEVGKWITANEYREITKQEY